MNTFGQYFRISIWGESHGPMIGVTIDGCHPGIPLSEGDLAADLDRRRGGKQPATTTRREADIPVFLSGIFNNHTTGAPLTIAFENKDVQSSDYDQMRSIPRPGHADFVAEKKFKGFQDYRGSGHFSGRLTVALVAAGVIAKKIIAHVYPTLQISAQLIEAGGQRDIESAIETAIQKKDSIGGVVECTAVSLPIGLGEPFFNSIESVISHLAFSIPAIKGIEFGSGFQAASMYGSEHNDALLNDAGQTQTNYAGGINGGITNGNDLVFRVAVKPTSSTPQQQTSFNKQVNQPTDFVVPGRHDLCIALRVPVVVEAITAIALIDFILADRSRH